jgi:coproporphyrinogen III oxidase-like Fe-S oxidoreductase
VTADDLAELAAGGFTRVSIGMQSVVPHVLRTLERTHDPARVATAVAAAKDAGLATSLDLIYGTPGRASPIGASPSIRLWHRSPTTSPPTPSSSRTARNWLPRSVGARSPSPTMISRRTCTSSPIAASAHQGYEWYEVSNWALAGGTDGLDRRSRHNLAYWQGHDWWGVGPGAHSHVGGVRWWNVKHPAAYADRIAWPGCPRRPGGRRSTPEQRHDEEVLLRVRLRDGLPIGVLDADGRTAVAGLVADGLVDGGAAVADRVVVLTRRGRLLADAVVRRLLGV